MGIDNIKPAGGHRPLDDVSAEPAGAPNGDASFSDARAKFQSEAAPTSTGSLGVVSQFKRSELDDPAKVDQMVRSSASELVNSQDTTSMLGGADKQKLVDFLSEDPAFRQRIEAYMRKALA